MPKRKSPPETPKKTDESQTTWKLLWWSVIAIVGLAVLSESLPRRPRKATETTPAGQGKTRTPSAKPVENEVVPPLSVNFKPFNVMGAELFTSFMVTCPEELTGITRTNFGIPVYGNGKTFGVVLKNVKKGETYKVTAKANGIINESVVVARISQDDPFVVVLTPIRANYNELAKVRQTIPMDFVFAVSKNNSEPTEQAQRWTVHQINDCPTLVTISTITPEGKIVSNRNKWPYTIAGFVNENHPWIDSVLHDALKHGRCKAFIGYQGGEDGIYEQVEAIWDTLQKMGVKYSSITTSTASGQHRFQHVRFLDESIRNTQANCLDGSVLFASIIRKIGLNASVFLVPGHAYVAIRDKQDTKYLYAIETTMLADAPLHRAVEAATVKQDFSLRRLLDDQSIECVEVNISEARKIGINPVPYLGSTNEPIAYQRSFITGTDQTSIDQTNYYNSIGMMTATQFNTMLNEKLADKSQFRRPPGSRIEVTRQLANKMEETKLQLQINPLSAANRSAWKDVIDEVNKHRNAFNNIKKPQFKSGTPQPELDKITPLYEESVILLKVSDPSLGKDPSQFTAKEVQDSIAAAENALRALRIISILPLDF